MSRSRSNFLAQLERAQFIAFSPFIFQAAAAALRTGLLETLSRSPGKTSPEPLLHPASHLTLPAF